jgi:hypothetical protein
MPSLKKLTCKGTLRQVAYLSEAYNPIIPFPQYILIHTGKGGGGKVEPERRGEGQQFTKLGRK